MTRGAVRRYCPSVMGGAARIVVVGSEGGSLRAAARDAELLLRDLHRRWTRFDANSELMRLCGAQGRRTLVSPATLRLVRAMRDAFEHTAGVVDASVLPDVVVHGGARSCVDPTAVTVLPVGARRGAPTDLVIEPDVGAVTLPPGLFLDAGGFGKGLAADLAVELLMNAGAAGALVEVDGDLRAAGDAPEPFGWVVDVEDPFAPGASITRIAIDAGGIATSSTLRHRWIPPDGPPGGTVHHLVGPASSAAPPDDEPATCTVVTGSGVDAEVLAKLPILLGERRGVEQVLALDTDALILLVRTDGSLATAGAWPWHDRPGAAGPIRADEDGTEGVA